VQVKAKESEVTSTIHTVNEINKILGLFGFSNFHLAESAETGFYQIVREDGTVVEETLSEGEYTFITFLYFYQLLKGSTEDSGMTRDKVVVFDDPISSLDSNVLFVVSNLIKEVVRDCRNGDNGIKQVFILTHNVYFHKEVTYRGGREQNKWKEESYWVVRKLDNKSNIIPYDDNPIQTTYELLWREARNVEEVNKATIYNSLRRILEYYFNIIGGLDYENCINEFEGEEKIICKSLISWINDGSHFINEDLIVYTELESVEKYLNVFKSIFEKMGHISHYEMMMKT
jgi:wobble nucleotide-excising tRNase